MRSHSHQGWPGRGPRASDSLRRISASAIRSIEAGMHEGQVTVAVPDGASVVPRLFGELDVHIRSVTVTRPSLDDVFLSYTGRTIRDSEGPRAGAGRATTR